MKEMEGPILINILVFYLPIAYIYGVDPYIGFLYSIYACELSLSGTFSYI